MACAASTGPFILLLGEDKRVRSIGVALYTEVEIHIRLYDGCLVSGTIHQVRIFLAFDPISYFAFGRCLTEGVSHDGGYNEALVRTSFKKIMVSGVYVAAGLCWSMWSGHHAVGQDGRRALAIDLLFTPGENWLSFILFSFLTVELMNQGLL
jgi:hypothetical protein